MINLFVWDDSDTHANGIVVSMGFEWAILDATHVNSVVSKGHPRTHLGVICDYLLNQHICIFTSLIITKPWDKQIKAGQRH